MTWPYWGTALDGAVGKLVTLGLATRGEGSLSLPTPNAFDAVTDFGNRLDNNQAEGGRHGVSLRHMVKEFLPTPRTCSAMQAEINPNAEFPNLETVIAQETGERGRLNPDFVSWMMNFPKGWLDIE